MSGELKIDIPKAQIENAIAVAIAESFSGERRDQIIRDVVRAHLNYTESSYSRETILSKSVGKLIREIAEQEIEKMMDVIRPDVASVVEKFLGKGFQESVITQLSAALLGKVVSGISISVAIDD